MNLIVLIEYSWTDIAYLHISILMYSCAYHLQQLDAVNLYSFDL